MNQDYTFQELAVLRAAIKHAADCDDKATAADLFGRVREIKKAVDACDKATKAIFDDVKHITDWEVSGLVKIARTNAKTDWRLDTDKLKADKGMDFYTSFCAPKTSYRILLTDV